MEIAHISDIHVKWAPGQRGPWRGFLNKRLVGGLNLALKRRHPEALLEAAIADLRERPPDHLAVTGDVSNLSLEAEFVRARELLARAELPPERISLIPGNHDAYTGGSYRHRLFERVFAGWLGGADVTWPRVQRRDDVLFVSVSSSVPTPWFAAYGRIGRVQLARVRDQLSADAGFKVVLVHHPPLLGNGLPDRVLRRNLDGGRLLEVCRDARADLILCGHTHRPFAFEVAGAHPLWIFCAGSTTRPLVDGLGSGATYNRYTVEDGRLRAVEVRGFDPAQGRFVEVERRTVSSTAPA